MFEQTKLAGTGYGLVVGNRKLYTWQSGDKFIAAMVCQTIVIDSSDFTVTAYDSPTIVELATAAPPTPLAFTCTIVAPPDPRRRRTRR